MITQEEKRKILQAFKRGLTEWNYAGNTIKERLEHKKVVENYLSVVLENL